MTKEEILKMAKQAGFERLGHDDCDYVCYPDEIEVFAKLIAEKEREACAQIAIYGCMVPPDGGSPTEDERLLCEHIAHSIRARGSV